MFARSATQLTVRLSAVNMQWEVVSIHGSIQHLADASPVPIAAFILKRMKGVTT